MVWVGSVGGVGGVGGWRGGGRGGGGGQTMPARLSGPARAAACAVSAPTDCCLCCPCAKCCLCCPFAECCRRCMCAEVLHALPRGQPTDRSSPSPPPPRPHTHHPVGAVTTPPGAALCSSSIHRWACPEGASCSSGGDLRKWEHESSRVGRAAGRAACTSDALLCCAGRTTQHAAFPDWHSNAIAAVTQQQVCRAQRSPACLSACPPCRTQDEEAIMHEAQQCDLTSWDKNKLRGSRHVTTSKHSPEEKEQLQRVRGRCGWERSVHELWRASRTAGLLAGEVLGVAAPHGSGNVARKRCAAGKRPEPAPTRASAHPAPLTPPTTGSGGADRHTLASVPAG